MSEVLSRGTEKGSQDAPILEDGFFLVAESLQKSANFLLEFLSVHFHHQSRLQMP